MLRNLTLYPDLPDQRRAQIIRDMAVAALIAAFCWCGLKVHDLVNDLAVFGSGLRAAGNSVQGGFGSVADAVQGIPVVGGQLGEAFRAAGQGTGGNVADLGQAGIDAVNGLATALGCFTAFLPILVLLIAVLPRRIRRVQDMSAARTVTHIDLLDPERQRLLAMRAAFGLPFRELLPYTNDPFGDLAAGRYDALVQAALADVGLRPSR